MKTKLLLVATVFGLLTVNAKAQIGQPPNGGFENWESVGIGAEDPVDWSSLNEFMFMGLPEFSFKTTDFNSGSFALRIISDTATIPPPFGTGALDTAAGMVVLGGMDFDNSGIPYTYRPDEMKVFVKGTVNAGDACFIVAELSKWNTGTSQRDVVGEAVYVMTTSIANYTEITISFNYSLPDIPDTLSIMIAGGNIGPGGTVIPGNEFFVDDISFVFNPVVAIFTASDTVICEGGCISFTDLSTETPTSWQWSFPGAIPTSSTAKNPTNICYDTAGFYDVQLIATNAFGSDTLLKTAYIQVDSCSTGINETQNEIELNIYPNPVANELTIAFSYSEKIIFEIFDVTGRKMKSTTFSGNRQKINIEELPVGLYIYQVTNSSGQLLKSGKVIIVR